MRIVRSSFFFSSRRRHTRCSRDWSSDVCSSDLRDRPGYSAADVHFVTGMIAHHAQAVLIAGWAPTHDASPALRALCERIVVGQRDEIAIMQRWLEERHQPVPDPDPPSPTMPGMDHPTLLPGMLTPA